MSDAAEKKRLARAVRRAADVLVNSNYDVTFLQGEVFNIEAVRKREIRKIRIVLDEVEKTDEQKIRAFKLPDVCTKEIWCKRANHPAFFIKEIR